MKWNRVRLTTGSSAKRLRIIQLLGATSQAATRQLPRSCLLTTHSLAASVRDFLRIDEIIADAFVSRVNLMLLRIVEPK
jgi:hypothetical protein